MAKEGINSEYGDPPAPQTEFNTQALPNSVAHIGSYTDRGITKRNVHQAGGYAPPSTPRRSGSTTLGNIRPFYAVDQLEEIAQTASNPHAPVPAYPPTAWAIHTDGIGIPRSRDFYRNCGMIGQSFFNNVTPVGCN